ncbi:MAG: 3-hydroxyacyl-CoA dehydrogenase/enoyl-CoA hydratase family protein [Chlorobi bacterium]|nr:3-hydroxyacyl-CoA dehydrogenase/enoyl-CoA hydratase family protein [Chlorobiota bacterium]
MKKINTVGVVGAGTMGSAIAQKFAQQGFKVILADRDMKYVNKGIDGIKEILRQAVERKLFMPKQVETTIANITGCDKLQDLKPCDLIVEAIFENFEAKSQLFADLDNIVDNDTIIATNTSSFSVSELAKSISNPSRFIGMHYFFHAAKNRLVEIIPGKETSETTYRTMQVFSVLSGKDAITTADTYGFAVNRFFVPWLNEAVRLYEENIASIPQIDNVCMKVFGIGMGPFALMNATGVPIAYHAQITLEVFGNLYKTSNLLKTQAESGNNWDLGDFDAAIADKNTENIIVERMAGVVFYVCSQILDDNICSATELNRGARIGLRWRKGPVDLMKKYGQRAVKGMIEKIADIYKVKVPDGIDEKNWQLDFVQLEVSGSKAIISMSRPEDMNALNVSLIKQLDEKFSLANANPDINTIFLTAKGKAFVAGADIRFFVKNIKAGKIDDIEAFTKYGQSVFAKIDSSKKKVVALINGLALGGGLELALCADIILAVPNALMAFPETGIGIYPGLGGTQRTAGKIGKGLSKYLIYTGQFINARTAFEIGLVDSLISPGDMFDILEGRKEIPEITNRGINEKYSSLEAFFNKFTIEDFFCKIHDNEYLDEEESSKMSRKICQKAPLALRTAEKLINLAAGPASELEDLKMIFSSSDALLGLSSIGKRVEFTGK